jgi:hypothetical protein
MFLVCLTFLTDYGVVHDVAEAYRVTERVREREREREREATSSTSSSCGNTEKRRYRRKGCVTIGLEYSIEARDVRSCDCCFTFIQ